MDVNAVQSLITTVGFPIFCVIALGWFIYKSYEKIIDRNKEREEKLYQMIDYNHQEMEKLEKTNSEFVKVLAEIKTLLQVNKTEKEAKDEA